MSCCKGPGYASPLDAFKNGPREELLYVVCVQPDNSKQDYLATIDVDPKSPTYNQVIHRTYTGSSGNELHHSGWNVCSSCHDNAELKRDLLIMPALHSCKVFTVDVGTDPRKPKLHKVIDGSEIRSFNCSFPHTTHCLADGNIMISTMGDKDENRKGDFVLIDSKTLKVTGIWTKGRVAKFGYDFWYQPYHDVMIASEFGSPNYFKFHHPNYGHHRFLLIDASSFGKSHYQVIDGSEMRSFNCSFPHTAHCLATGEIMISTMGDKDYEGKGDFILIDSKTLKVTGTWTKGRTAKFGYDFWYQPYHDVMVSSEWGTPKYFKTGFHPEDIENEGRYGTSLNIYKWSTHELQQVIDLGQEGCAPLEIRFLHDPKASQGFVGCAVQANVYRFYKDAEGSWKVHKVIDVPAKKVSKDGVESELNGLMSDILISLDDRYLYFTCWLHGDVRQYDISDPEHPKFVSRVQLGGKIVNDDLKVVDDKELKEPPKPVTVKGKRLWGAPQMLQLSLDGKRLYVSSSLYSPWDKQFYPKMTDQGGWLVKLDVDTVNGGMKLDPDFLVDFGNEPNGPVLPHEMRYPGGDCTSDIWLAED